MIGYKRLRACAVTQPELYIPGKYAAGGESPPADRKEGNILVWFLFFNGVLLLQIGAVAMIGYGNQAVRRGGILITGGTEVLFAIIACRADEMTAGCGVAGCIITLLMLLLIWMLSW